MLSEPTPVDPEVAAATFSRHLDAFWQGLRADRSDWELYRIDDLNVVIKLYAVRSDGVREDYYLKLGANFYDSWPPLAWFVKPNDWSQADPGSQWWPKLATTPTWFGLHASYPYRDGSQRPLLCFTHCAQYYQTNHAPEEHTVWKQGRHTLAMTVNRVAEILRPPYYAGRSDI
ncbi:hypothetical protein CCAX7_60940 [Capsulimonas corticalis]|uniref:Uncharacterized protein n=1 Tax=Capsulimonas corticalis TaxID=2219043 RepID=A0A402CW45_9BACT|nr:hypothetical protein [Capsulimonas corticalis]BDI34043.1 hypothetical protein CCAX7_60940 [Capsulimonas corticalis]